MFQSLFNMAHEPRQFVFDCFSFCLDLIRHALAFTEVHKDGKGYHHGRQKRKDEEYRNGKDSDEHCFHNTVRDMHLWRDVHSCRFQIGFQLHPLVFVQAQPLGDPHRQVMQPDLESSCLLFLPLGKVSRCR